MILKAIKSWNRKRVQRRRNERVGISYCEWIRRNESGIGEVASYENSSRVSVVVPLYNPKLNFLKLALDSVFEQTASNVELCVVDDASPNNNVRPFLESVSVGRGDKFRVHYRIANGHISRATNDAVSISSGDWICFLDQDDLLSPNAVEEFDRLVAANPSLKLVYSDEDKVDEQGRRFGPYFKPDLNRELILSQNYFCHLVFIRKELFEELGGLRAGYEGAQDHDLVLRALAVLKNNEVGHISKVLYHWRSHSGSTALDVSEKSYAVDAAIRAVCSALDESRVAYDDVVAANGTSGIRVKYSLPNDMPLVSIIVPTRNAEGLVRQLMRSLDLTSYKNYEVILVDNGSDDVSALTYFSELQRAGEVRLLRDDGPFNYSRLNNKAAKAARGDFLLLLNNDIEVTDSEWLSEMLSHAARQGVGCVGCRLLYPDGSIQHAGVVIGMGGVAGHVFSGLPANAGGYFNRAQVAQELSAVTAACLMVSKHIFEEVGGLNEEQFAVAFNDVDFCLKVREAGYRNIYTPHACLVHHESATRGKDEHGEKAARFRREVESFKNLWASSLLNDPAYNVNLALDSNRCELAVKVRNSKN